MVFYKGFFYEKAFITLGAAIYKLNLRAHYPRLCVHRTKQRANPVGKVLVLAQAYCNAHLLRSSSSSPTSGRALAELSITRIGITLHLREKFVIRFIIPFEVGDMNRSSESSRLTMNERVREA